jgi:DNA-binding NarL/FixJ family response regulator
MRWHGVGHPQARTERIAAVEAADLTEREIAILQAVAAGLSSKPIGREYWVTEQAVKFHLTNIYRKLGVPNRTAAAQYAHQHGLLDTPGSAPYKPGTLG